MSITFRSREEALTANPALARAVLDWQKWADPSLDPWEVGQEVVVDLEADECVVLDEAMCREWNERDRRSYDGVRDHVPLPEHLEYVDQIIAFAQAENVEALFQANAQCWVRLCKEVGWGPTWFIGVLANPILDQDNDYPLMQAAHDRLIEMGLTKDYSAAIRADGEELFLLMRDFAALARFDASSPYIFFSAEGAETSCAFCKHINYHLDTYSQADDKRLREALSDAGFVTSEDGRCYEPFGEDSAIEGRRLDVSKL